MVHTGFQPLTMERSSAARAPAPLEKIVQDVEKAYSCQSIKIETPVENVD